MARRARLARSRPPVRDPVKALMRELLEARREVLAVRREARAVKAMLPRRLLPVMTAVYEEE